MQLELTIIYKRLVKYVLGLLHYQPTIISPSQWDDQHSNGAWLSLRQVNQLSHNSVINGYAQFYAPHSSILDLGCGDGFLQEMLNHTYNKYVGVDISSFAFKNKIGDEKTFFIQSDVSNFSPEQLFDVIIFNECLYYFAQPLVILKRYENFLNFDGVFIVSLTREKQPDRIWKMISSNYHTEDETKVINHLGAAWTIKVLRPIPKTANL